MSVFQNSIKNEQDELVVWFRSLPEEQRKAFILGLSDTERTQFISTLRWNWLSFARAEQLPPPGDWNTWLIMAGRGFGKSEAGAQWIKSLVLQGVKRIGIVAETQKDLEEVLAPRIVAVHPPHEAPKLRTRPVRLTWSNGAVALGYNGTEPDQLRGPEFEALLFDELAKYDKAREVWDMGQFTLRSGDHPRAMITTTPRNIPIIKDIIADPKTVVTRGSTYDNAANLSKNFLDAIKTKYEGTRLGRQEINAEILEDLVGALWRRESIDTLRINLAPELQRIVVAVDPSGVGGADDPGDSQGIVVAGLGVDKNVYILADRSCKLSADGWARRVITAYHEFGADIVVAEKNYGGDMVKAVIKTVDKKANVVLVTATRGKVVRAEPVSALYEQKRVRHVGSFPELEDQLCLFSPNGYEGEGSPDRADALVWAVTALMPDSQKAPAGVRTVKFGRQ